MPHETKTPIYYISTKDCSGTFNDSLNLCANYLKGVILRHRRYIFAHTRDILIDYGGEYSILNGPRETTLYGKGAGNNPWVPTCPGGSTLKTSIRGTTRHGTHGTDLRGLNWLAWLR